jgi:hypothetical protein
VRAREGDVAAAEEAIREAIEIVERTDFLFDRADGLRGSRRAPADSGTEEESRSALERG